MAQAYRRIFDRFGLRYRAVAADSGAIGGDLSEEFQVIAATGEDAIVYCPDSDYAANMEKAEALAPAGPRAARRRRRWPRRRRPGKSTCADVAELLGVPLAHHRQVAGAGHRRARRRRRKSASAQVWLLLLRGDHDMNEIKVGKVPGLDAGLPLRHAGRDRGALRLQARLPRPARPEAAGEDRGRPRGGA